MATSVYLLVIFCTLSPCLAGVFQLEHPQQAFCEADFVIRAVVISGPETLPKGVYDVFNIIIREVFKGLPDGSEEQAFGVLNTELPTKLYTWSNKISTSISGSLKIKTGTEYYIYGAIQGGKLFTKFSFLRGEWSKVTPRQKANLRGYYEAGCHQCIFRRNECSGSPDIRCREKLPGCEQKAGDMSRSRMKSICWRQFELCEVDETGQRCHWKETDQSKECMNDPSSFIRW